MAQRRKTTVTDAPKRQRGKLPPTAYSDVIQAALELGMRLRPFIDTADPTERDKLVCYDSAHDYVLSDVGSLLRTLTVDDRAAREAAVIAKRDWEPVLNQAMQDLAPVFTELFEGRQRPERAKASARRTQG